MFNIIKPHHYLLPPFLFPTSFSTKKHNPRKVPPAPPKPLADRRLQQQLTMLQTQTKKFSKQIHEQISIAKKSRINYMVLLARSILIANKSIGLELAYSQIKKIINSNRDPLTPYTCTALMECMGYFKFDGDEQNILDKLCRYYQNYYVLFTQKQEKQFWSNYAKVMSNKVHSSLQFINLTRKQHEIFELSPMNVIISKWMRYTKVNDSIVKNVNMDGSNQVTLNINKPNWSNFDIKIKFKQIINIDNMKQNVQHDLQYSQVEGQIYHEIAGLNALMKKGWNVIIHGKLLTDFSEKQQNITTSSDTQKIISHGNNFSINQQVLNNPLNRGKLLTSNHYCKGIFYNQMTTKKKQIDIIPTLMLGINSKNLQISKIKYIQQNFINFSNSQIINYISLNQLRQCYGYAKISQNHWNLFQSFCNVQNFLQFLASEQEQQQYNLKQIQQAIKSGQLTKSQANRILSSQSEMMTEMTMKSARSVQNLLFASSYNNQYKTIHQILGYIGGEEFWQMRPLLEDSLRVMKMIEQIGEEERMDGKKSVKIVVLSSKYHIPYLFQNVAQGKYYTTQKYRQSNEDKRQKQQIIKQLYSRASKIQA